jgi:hypothetical protein
VQFSNSRESVLVVEFAEYLEEAAQASRVMGAIPGQGSLPPGTGPWGRARRDRDADSTAQRPFEVFSEFEIRHHDGAHCQRCRGWRNLHTRPAGRSGIAPTGIAAAN